MLRGVINPWKSRVGKRERERGDVKVKRRKRAVGQTEGEEMERSLCLSPR